MIETVRNVLAALFLAGGLAFMLVGAIGIVRFPDAYNRLHASSKCATLGLMGVLLGAVLHIGTIAFAIKALVTIIFAFVANPTGSHILAKAAHIDGLDQWPGTLSDELTQDKREAAEAERRGSGQTRFNIELPPRKDDAVEQEAQV